MNKGFWVITFIVLFLVFPLAGCPARNEAAKGGENALVNKESAAADKKEEKTPANNTTAQNKEILWDFRKNDGSKPQDFPKAETDAVLKYLLETDKWDPELQITDRVSGAFTKPNAKETLYFVTGCKDEAGKFISNSTCGHVGWNTAGWIAVYDGTTPVLKIEEALGGGIEKVTDVNGDGINEILSFGGYAGMGIETESGSLGQISGDKFKEIKNFYGAADNCADTLSKDKKAVAAVISYTPTTDGKTPDFSEEHFQGTCKDDSISPNQQWKKITKKQFDDFFESIS